jgi:hypothetical protein
MKLKLTELAGAEIDDSRPSGRCRTVEGGGSVGTARNRHRPDIRELSSSVYAVVPVGHMSRPQFMGALTVGPSSEIVTARVSGIASGVIAAFTMLGYARASARLHVKIEAEGRMVFARLKPGM